MRLAARNSRCRYGRAVCCPVGVAVCRSGGEFDDRIAVLRPLLLLLCPLMRPAGAGPQYANTPLHEAQPVYRLAVHPLYNLAKLAETYQPLIDYLNRHIRGRVSNSKPHAITRCTKPSCAHQPQLLLPNPWQTLLAIGHSYTVIAMAGDAADFRGPVHRAQDSGIVSPGDLKGKTVAYPSPTALAACIMAQGIPARAQSRRDARHR